MASVLHADGTGVIGAVNHSGHFRYRRAPDVRPLCAREYEQKFRFAVPPPIPRGRACPCAGHVWWPPLAGHEAGARIHRGGRCLGVHSRLPTISPITGVSSA